MSQVLISIAESLHASIPKYGKIMRELLEMGDNAYTEPSEALEAIKQLIESQADDGAAYIAINLDDFGETDSSLAARLMVEYVKLVRKWGKGVPAQRSAGKEGGAVRTEGGKQGEEYPVSAVLHASQ